MLMNGLGVNLILGPTVKKHVHLSSLSILGMKHKPCRRLSFPIDVFFESLTGEWHAINKVADDLLPVN